MNWPQWTWIVLMGIAWFATLVDHGKPKKGKDDIGIATAVVGIHVFLLWQGGFFG